MRRAWLWGGFVIVLIHALLWLTFLDVPYAEYLRSLLLGGVAFAAMLATFLTSRHPFLVGMGLLPVAVIVGYLANSAYKALGYPVDSVGVDFTSTLQVLLMVNFLNLLVGSAMGMLFRKINAIRNH